ncbi:hypothetical protein L204_100228 [Cryptococcus depauperatus]
MATLRWAKFTLYSSIIIATGVFLKSKTVPDEKELYSQLSPELKNKMDQIMHQREGKITTKEKLQEAGNKDEVVWGDQLVAKQKPWRSCISSCWILLMFKIEI